MRPEAVPAHLFYDAQLEVLKSLLSSHCPHVGATPGPAFSQQSPLPDAPQPQNQARQAAQSDPEQNSERNKVSKNHIFWVIPNYRADESQAEFKPLTPGLNLRSPWTILFDPSAFLVAGVFAGISMAQKQYPHFGQGQKGLASTMEERLPTRRLAIL